MVKTPASIKNIHVTLDVFNVNFSPLISLNILDGNKLMIDNFNTKLAFQTQLMPKNKIFFIEEYHVPIFRSPSSHLHALKEPLYIATTNFTVC